MKKNIMSYSPEDRIEHKVFGTGTIVELSDQYTTIAFDESGTRKFITSMVKVKPSDTEAPPPKRGGAKKKKKKKTTTKAKTKTKRAK